MDRQEVIAVLDEFGVGQKLAADWPSYRERIADALIEKAGGEEDASQLGVDCQAVTGGQQAAGDLLSRLEAIRSRVITAPEERAVQECIDAAQEALG